MNLKLRIRLQFSSRKTFFFSVFKQTFFAVSPLLALSFQSVFMCQTKFSDDDDDGTFESCFSFHCVLISLLREVCKTCQSYSYGQVTQNCDFGFQIPSSVSNICNGLNTFWRSLLSFIKSQIFAKDQSTTLKNPQSCHI